MNEPGEVSRLISRLKGTRTTAEIVKGADVSRETFRKIERGQQVSLDRLMRIAKFLNASEKQRTQIVIGWVKMEIGEHAKKIRICQANADDVKNSEDEELQSTLKELSPSDKQQFLKAMNRPEICSFLRAVNTMYDSIKSR